MCSGKFWAWEEGLAALRSLSTIKKWALSKFLRQQMAISIFLSDVSCINTRCGGGDIHPSITLNIKYALERLTFNILIFPPKFIRAPFLHIPCMPPGHTLQQNGYLKMLIRCVWGNVGRGKEGSCPPITCDF